jgi:micrococcal nuclease
MTTRIFTVAFLALVSAAAPAYAKAPRVHKPPTVIEGTITWDDHGGKRDPDGDTPWIKRNDGTEQKVRLHLADTPETKHAKGEVDQPFARDAIAYERKHWEGKTVTATQHGVSYGRPIVDVVETATGENLALDLVRLGLAVADPRFHPPKSFLDAQDEAKKKHLGMWSQKEVITPSDWRKQSRNKKEK